MDIIPIAAIVTPVLVGAFVYYHRKYSKRPELTIQIQHHWGHSFNRGVSGNNTLTAEGYIDGNNAVYHFEVSWDFSIIIRNNSEYVAYYPTISFPKAQPKIELEAKLNDQIPIKAHEEVKLKGTYTIVEEKKGIDRTQPGAFPKELEAMRILLEYRNTHKHIMYTIYEYNKGQPKNTFVRELPWDFKK